MKKLVILIIVINAALSSLATFKADPLMTFYKFQQITVEGTWSPAKTYDGVG